MCVFMCVRVLYVNTSCEGRTYVVCRGTLWVVVVTLCGHDVSVYFVWFMLVEYVIYLCVYIVCWVRVLSEYICYE